MGCMGGGWSIAYKVAAACRATGCRTAYRAVAACRVARCQIVGGMLWAVDCSHFDHSEKPTGTLPTCQLTRPSGGFSNSKAWHCFPYSTFTSFFKVYILNVLPVNENCTNCLDREVSLSILSLFAPLASSRCDSGKDC
ncbi:unnamed protein product [Victoria cruziana]